LEEEIWKDVENIKDINYEGLYQVSTFGRVKGLERVVKHSRGGVQTIPERILALQISKNGYVRVELNKDGKGIKYLVHRLIAQTFISNPDNKPCINHISGVKTDNSVRNLEFCFHIENTNHAFKTGLMYGRKGVEHDHKLPEYRVRIIKKLKGIKSNSELALYFKVCHQNISCIQTGKSWQHATI